MTYKLFGGDVFGQESSGANRRYLEELCFDRAGGKEHG